MSGMFNNFADPVLEIVSKFLESKRMISANLEAAGTSGTTQPYYAPDTLPDLPMYIVRNGNIVETIIHGNTDDLSDPNADPLIWKEDFIRVDGRVTQIVTTYPNGGQSTTDITRQNGKVVSIE